MPKGPQGQKRPADPVAAAIVVAKIATGEIAEAAGLGDDESKDPAAVSLGRRGGLKGGASRAKKLSAEKRSEIARHAAAVKYGKKT
jgi:hypothetical protein